jgi:hypothetical protein
LPSPLTSATLHPRWSRRHSGEHKTSALRTSGLRAAALIDPET